MRELAYYEAKFEALEEIMAADRARPFDQWDFFKLEPAPPRVSKSAKTNMPSA